jgi:type I restriction enzyme, S subunit
LQSVFYEMFGDLSSDQNNKNLKKFAECVDFQEGPGIMAEDFIESGIPLLRLTNIKGSKVILENCNYLSPAKVERKWKHFRVKENDILISSSASTGIVSEVTKESEGAIPYTGIIRLRPKTSGLERIYLKYFVESPFFTHQIKSFTTGSTIHHYGPTHLKKMQIIIPPLALQQQFARIVEEVERIHEQQAESGNEIAALCGVLMQRAFRGELVC